VTSYNFVQPWLDYQKKFLDYWQQSAGHDTQLKEPKNMANYTEATKPWRDAVRQWSDLVSASYAHNVSEVFNAMPQYQEFMNKLSDWPFGAQGLQRFWEELNTGITSAQSDPLKLYIRWNNEYINLFPKNLVAFLPEQIKPLFDKAIDLYAFSKTSTSDFFKPWLDKAQKMHNLLLRSMTGDQSSYNEFVKLWQGTFTSSIGKMVNVSQLSMNRETLQTQMSSINAMITLINTLNEYIATLVKTSQDTLEKLIIDYRAMVIEGNNPKSYSEFYDYWWKQNEAAYLQLFGTPEFARLSG
jgi:hypothetical protein